MSRTTPDLLGATEAAELLGISRRTLHRRITKGQIPGQKLAGITGAYVIDRATVEQILAEKKKTPRPAH